MAASASHGSCATPASSAPVAGETARLRRGGTRKLGRSAASRWECRHYVHTYGNRLPLPGRRPGRLEPQGRRLVNDELPAGRIGCRGAANGESANAGPKTSSIIATRDRNIRLWCSTNAARRRACVRRWARWATPTITPCARASSPRLNANCWTAVASRPRPRHAWRASASSRADTTPCGYILPWGIARL